MSDNATTRALRARPPRAARAWVERVTGRPIVAVTRLRGGVAHATHRVHLRGGGRVVLRRWARPHWAAADPQYSAGHEAMLLTLLERAGIAAPRLIAVDAVGDGCDVPAVLQSEIRGHPPTDLMLHRESVLGALAQAAAQLHGIDVGDQLASLPPYVPYTAAADLSAPAWGERSLFERAINAARRSAPAGRECLIHRDLHPGNTLWRRRDLLGIVDWDRASRGNPAVDLARTRINLVLRAGAGAAERFTIEYIRLRPLPADELAHWDVVDSLDLIEDLQLDPTADHRTVCAVEQHLAAALDSLAG